MIVNLQMLLISIWEFGSASTRAHLPTAASGLQRSEVCETCRRSTCCDVGGGRTGRSWIRRS